MDDIAVILEEGMGTPYLAIFDGGDKPIIDPVSKLPIGMFLDNFIYAIMICKMVNAVSLFRSAPVQGVKRSLVKRVSFVPEMAIISVKVYNKGPRNVNLSQKRDSLLKDLDKDYSSGKLSKDKYEKQKKIIKPLYYY